MPSCFACESPNVVELPDSEVCADCGVVQRMGFVSEAPEWRNFEDASDRSRVGDPSAPLQTYVQGAGGMAQRLQQVQMQLRTLPRPTERALHANMEVAAELLLLPSGTCQLAKQLGSDFLRVHCLRGHKQLVSLVGACLHYACNDVAGRVRAPERVLEVLSSARAGFLLTKEELRDPFYHMLGWVYQTLLFHFSRQYTALLKAQDTDGASQIRAAVRQVADVPPTYEKLVYRKALQLRYQLVQVMEAEPPSASREFLDMVPKVQHAILIETAALIYGLRLKKITFCRNLEISQTTLCNTERVLRAWLDAHPSQAQIILLP